MRPITRPSQKQSIVSNSVWDMISPAVPDCLEHLGGGVYQATWWKPVPVMDVEIMKRIEGIDIVSEPYEPKSLPGGVTMRFWVTSD